MLKRTYPIVLAHGIARFDVLLDIAVDIDNKDELDDKHYFKNIRTHLNSSGFDAWHTQVDWAGSVGKRAADLKRGVEGVLLATGAEKVHIIAHSMGGLDARHMLFDNRQESFHAKVASVTTIGTPHAGSPVADFVLDPLALLGEAALETVATAASVVSFEEAVAEWKRSEEFRGFAQVFAVDAEKFGARGVPELESVGGFSGLAGIRDLTTEAARTFNAESLEWERTTGVFFEAYAGAQPRDRIFPPLRFPWKIIHGAQGANDGLVSVQSAKWTESIFKKTLDADHLNELGWWPDVRDPVARADKERESKAFYLGLAESLATRFHG